MSNARKLLLSSAADPVDVAREFAANAEQYQNKIDAWALSIPPEVANGMRDGMRQVFGHYIKEQVAGDDGYIAAMLGVTIELVADRLTHKAGVPVLIPERDATVRGVELYVTTLLRNAMRARAGMMPPQGTG